MAENRRLRSYRDEEALITTDKTNEPITNINNEFKDQHKCLEYIFKQAEGKIGIYPITFEDVKRLANIKDHPNIEYDTESMFMKSQDYHTARMNVAYDFCSKALRIPSHMITIFNVKCCIHPKDKIFWLSVRKEFATWMFI